MRRLCRSPWDGGGADANWTTGNNWDTNVVPAAAKDVTFGSAFTSGTALSLNGDKNANSLTVDTGTGFTLSSNTLTLTAGTLTRTPTSFGTQIVSSQVTAGANATWNIGGLGSVNLTNNVNGNRDISKTGNGTLVLQG